MKTIIIFSIFIGHLLFSFTEDKNSFKRYKAFKSWYEQNHCKLKVEKSKGSIIYQVEYLPNELKIFQELYRGGDYSKKNIQRLYSVLNIYNEFNIKIYIANEKDLILSNSVDKEDYLKKQFYLIESVRDDIYLIRDKDTLLPIECRFENNHGTAPYILLHLAFEKAPKKNIQHQFLSFHDQLFLSETFNFDFSKILNTKIPKIK